MKSLFKNTRIVITAALLVAPFAITACADDSEGDNNEANNADVGSLGLNLAVAPGQNVSSVTYTITHPDHPTVSGNLPLGASQTISMRIGGLPQATGYTIRLSGVSDEGGAECLGEATFDVVAGQVASASIILSCAVADGEGDVNVDVEVNTCPDIKSVVVHPLTAEYGGQINFKAEASDADGDAVSYSWSVEGTEVSTDSTGAWPCAAPEEYKDLLLTVTDGKCEDNSLIQVYCKAPGVCGNGVLEAGEECDDNNNVDDDACPNNCILPVCGDGSITGNEKCEPTGPDDLICYPVGDANECQLREENCGDGLVTHEEDCEPSAGNLAAGDATCYGTDAGDLACRTRVASCGDGFITAPEACDISAGSDPSSCNPQGHAQECQEIVWLWNNEACTTCVTNFCDNPNSGYQSPTATCPLNDAACRKVSDCMYDTKCVDPTLGPAPCYCGSLSIANGQCWDNGEAGNHDGACADEISEGFPGLQPADISLAFTDADEGPSGRAGNANQCMAFYCYDQCFGN